MRTQDKTVRRVTRL